MRHYLFWILAAGVVIPAFGAEKSGYYHDDTPLSAHHSIYSDIFIHKWLDAPRDGFKPIPLAEQLKISDTADAPKVIIPVVEIFL